MADGLNRFLGDSPGRTLIKLLVISVAVGFVMSSLGLYPMDIVNWIRASLYDLWRSGFAAIGRVGDYLLLGAAVVVPVFIILRLLNMRKS
jgi:hypothetical protein